MTEETEYVGLNAFSNMYIEMATQSADNNDDISRKEFLEMAIRMNPDSSDAWEGLAIFYEIADRKPEAAEGLYLKAISLDPNNSRILYNFGNFYEENKDYTNMLKYYQLAAELNDSDSCFRMALYYFNIKKDKKLGLEFYLQGLGFSKIEEEPSLNDYNNKHMAIHLPKKYKDFNHYELVELLENLEPKSESVKKTIKTLCQKEAIISYKNKLRVFERLKNICECKICYEERLNIDLTCGHEVCIDCYKKVYKNLCPWCRIPSYFNKCVF
jgi:tetratricopeptide (TPR) repeat protein